MNNQEIIRLLVEVCDCLHAIKAYYSEKQVLPRVLDGLRADLDKVIAELQRRDEGV